MHLAAPIALDTNCYTLHTHAQALKWGSTIRNPIQQTRHLLPLTTTTAVLNEACTARNEAPALILTDSATSILTSGPIVSAHWWTVHLQLQMNLGIGNRPSSASRKGGLSGRAPWTMMLNWMAMMTMGEAVCIEHWAGPWMYEQYGCWAGISMLDWVEALEGASRMVRWGSGAWCPTTMMINVPFQASNGKWKVHWMCIEL